MTIFTLFKSLVCWHSLCEMAGVLKNEKNKTKHIKRN